MTARLTKGSDEYNALRVLKRGGRQLTYTEQLAMRHLITWGLITDGPDFTVTAEGDRTLAAVEAEGRATPERGRGRNAADDA